MSVDGAHAVFPRVVTLRVAGVRVSDRALYFVLAMGGRAEVAALLLAADQELREELGGGFAWVVENNSETLAKLRTQLDELTLEEAFAQGRKLTPDEAVAIALGAAE
jgi:hypothetical protein